MNLHSISSPISKDGQVTSKKELLIALTFDADYDYFDSSMRDDGAAPTFEWRGIEEGIDVIRGITKTLPLTWFVRVDNQLHTIYGDSGYLLDHYSFIWSSCKNNGDEIGWHPHLYKQQGNLWTQETDAATLKKNLTQAHGALKKRGFTPTSVRIGDAFGSNAIFSILDDLGLRCDSSAMPGRVRTDGERTIDWTGTPNLPYHPSRTDYRKTGNPSLKILEVPMSMVPVQASYDKEPYSRYVDLTFFHEALKPGLQNFLKTADLLVTISHPSTVLPHVAMKPHGLLSFNATEFCKTFEFIISECKRLERPYRFITVKDCL